MSQEPVDLKAMAREDTQAYYTLWHKTRDPLYLYNAKVAARAFVELCAFRLARDSRWTIFLEGSQEPYCWFDSTGTWSALARLRHVANTQGAKASLYFEGDFRSPYHTAWPTYVQRPE